LPEERDGFGNLGMSAGGLELDRDNIKVTMVVINNNLAGNFGAHF